MRRVAGLIDRLLGALCAAAAWLTLPVVAALFAQWPSRDLLRCCSREWNDAGQWLFALYVAVAVTAATRAGAHLAAGHRRSAETGGGRALAVALALLATGFGLALALLAAPAALISLAQVERFPDTGNPFYFMIRVSAFLMAALIFLQGLVDLAAATRPGSAT